MKRFILLMMSFGLLMAVTSSALKAQTIPVNGTISSELLKLVFTPNGVTAQFKDTWTGDITGHGHTHIFSSGPIDPTTGQITDVTSRIFIFTPEGNMIWDGVGTVTGPFLQVVSTMYHGTGIYQNAEGQMTSNGVLTPDGQVSNYTGTITLNP